MRSYKRTLIPATTFFTLICLLSAFLPISGANWQEVLTVSGNAKSIILPTSLTPPSSIVGTTLLATEVATGFLEERDGITVFGVHGEVCVANSGEEATQGLTIFYNAQPLSGPDQFQYYVSEPVDIDAKSVLEAYEEHCYSYEFIFQPAAGENVVYRNTVSVTILNHSGWLPGGNYCVGSNACPFGPKLYADFTLPEGTSNPVEPPPTQPVSTEAITTAVPTVIQLQETDLPPNSPTGTTFWLPRLYMDSSRNERVSPSLECVAKFASRIAEERPPRD